MTEEVAKENFRDDVSRYQDADMGGVEIGGDVYTEWEKLPEEAKKTYKKEAQIVGRCEYNSE